MRIVVGLASFLAGLIVAGIVVVVTNVSTGSTVLWESCQPKTIDYGAPNGVATPGFEDSQRHYCVRLVDRSFAFWSRGRELAIVDRNDYGYYLRDAAIVAYDAAGARAHWTPEGVEFSNSRGIRLFVPKQQLTSGR